MRPGRFFFGKYLQHSERQHNMKATSFNTGWTCRHLGSSAPGTPVTLPHDAMLAEERSQTSAGGTNTGWFAG